MKRIVLCGDDFGQAAKISQGILALLESNNLSATSCLVNFSHWHQHANWLKSAKQVGIGLHLNLTEGRALSPLYQKYYGEYFYSLNKLLFLSLSGQLNSFVIQDEFERQLMRFTHAMGFLPHFIDGHQHVHQLPIIRRAMVNLYKKHMDNSHSFIRAAIEKLSIKDVFSTPKKFIVRGTALFFLNRLCTEGIAHNQSFSGSYAFNRNRNYRQCFIRFLKEIKDGGVLMCHPALAQSKDAIGHARYQEFLYLSSIAFKEDLRFYGVSLSPSIHCH